MTKFDFYLDRNVTSWMREHHTIEANSIEEAREKMIQNFIDNGCSESFMEQEFCHGSEEFLMPYDNNEQPTMELYDWLSDELLIDNSPTNEE
jgi:hypothetical protein